MVNKSNIWSIIHVKSCFFFYIKCFCIAVDSVSFGFWGYGGRQKT